MKGGEKINRKLIPFDLLCPYSFDYVNGLMSFKSAERVETAEGRQYHIGLAPGDLAPFVLLCGEPLRVERTAKYLRKTKKPVRSREYVTVTGEYEGVPVSVMATGMGPDNTEMAVVEMGQILKEATLIRIGSSGGLQKNMKLGELVISTGAVRLENTTRFFVEEGYPAVAHHEVTLALIQSAHDAGYRHHVGLTATAPGFYGAQSRRVPRFPPRFPELPKTLAAMKVQNFEMEASALFVLAGLAGFRAGAVCALYASRGENRFIGKKEMLQAEERCIRTGLGAVSLLARMDRKRKKEPYWLPKMGL